MAEEIVIIEGATSPNAESSDLVDVSKASTVAAPAAATVTTAAANPQAPNKTYRNAGVADIVLLIDITGSMRPCTDALVKNINFFIDMLTSSDGNGPVVYDWRMRVVGYRDYNADGPDFWLVENAFTRDVTILRKQLEVLDPKGGGDIPESLLDAMMTIATAGSLDLQAGTADENSNKWRPQGEAARFVVVFSDAIYHPEMSIPGYEGATLMDLINVYKQERIKPFFFMPEHDFSEALNEFYGAIVNQYSVGADGKAAEGLRVVTEKPAEFQKLLMELAKGVSQSASSQVRVTL